MEHLDETLSQAKPVGALKRVFSPVGLKKWAVLDSKTGEVGKIFRPRV